MDTKNLITQKHYFRGELALLIAVLMNSFGVVLMLHSGSGISAISSVPYHTFHSALGLISFRDFSFSHL